MATPEQLMQIGQKVVEYNNKGEGRKAVRELYTKDAVSSEAIAMPGQDSNEVQGVEAILGKHDWWEGAHEIHSTNAEGPYAHSDGKFSVIFDMDITTKETGDRSQMREVGTYYVNDAGQIHREEFAYPLG